MTVNAGSSSIKIGLFRGLQGQEQPISFANAQFDGIGTIPRLRIKRADGTLVAEKHFDTQDVNRRSDAFALIFPAILEELKGERPALFSHRVVHGGAIFKGPVLITPQYIEEIRKLIPLAPLHQSYNLAPIEDIYQETPDLPQVACFDTAFHAGRSEISMITGLPYRYYAEEGIKRYGVHGLSFEYISHSLKKQMPNLAHGRVIVAHLGSGIGLCAIKDGKSTEVTTSFTALDGAPMGTRPGTLDPGIILHLVGQGKTHKELEQLLYRESGLLGISGISNDMRKLHESTDPRAKLAIDYLAYQLAQQVGRLAVTLGGLDALIFTAGIGENDPALRAQVTQYLQPIFKLDIDQQANQHNALHISSPSSAVQVLVMPTDEESMLAKDAWAIYSSRH